MPSDIKLLATPLHLLDELSLGLIARMESVCCSAIAEAESIAGKQDKVCAQTQKKLLKARLNLQAAVMAGKTGVQTRARKRVVELEEKLFLLKERRAKALQQLGDLRRDTEQSMIMAEGVKDVREAARKALSRRKSKHTVYRAGVPKVAAG